MSGAKLVAPADLAKGAVPAVASLAKPAIEAAAAGAGLDPRGVEYEAIAKLSREIIERIAWEIIPDLAEQIIRQHVEKLAAGRRS